MRARLLRSAATAVLVVAAGVYFSSASSWRDVTRSLAEVQGRHLWVVLVLTAVNLVSYWAVMAAALPRLGIGRAAAVHLPSTAVANTVPVGGALGTGLSFAILRRWGFSQGEIAATMATTGVWNLLAKLAAPLAALVILTGSGRLDGVAFTAALGGAVALGVVVATIVVAVRSEGTARRVGALAAAVVAAPFRWARRSPPRGVSGRVVRLHHQVRTLVQRRWAAVTLAMVLSHALLFVLLVESVRAVGISSSQVTVAELVGVFAVARVASLVPLTPGGVGMIELSLTTSLAAADGAPDRAIAAVVVYRAATYLLPTVLGGLALAAWVARAGRVWSAPAPADLPRPDVPLVVDLDGTLFPVTTRTLMLSRLIRLGPSEVWDYRRRHREDRLASKLFLFDRVGLSVERAPQRRRLVGWLEDQHRSGRRLYLASGAPDPVVQDVVARHPMFSGGWGSTPGVHLVGPDKARCLREEFGPAGFDYVGDSAEDLPVWQAARAAILCAPPRRVARGARRVARVELAFPRLPGHRLSLAAQTVQAGLRQGPPRPTPGRRSEVPPSETLRPETLRPETLRPETLQAETTAP